MTERLTLVVDNDDPAAAEQQEEAQRQVEPAPDRVFSTLGKCVAFAVAYVFIMVLLELGA
ncbi:hypothetical protein [Pelagibius sp.]|uniref:hypothetical protein n=1 Tax=Pelagibius sp. TaxID=1931238 RepID=UPI003BAF9F80